MLESAVAAAAMAQDEWAMPARSIRCLRGFPEAADAQTVEARLAGSTDQALAVLDRPFRTWA